MATNRAEQANQIIRALASAPGIEALSIIATTFPRFGPAEPGTGYRQAVLKFGAEQVPADLRIPVESEEITIAMRGWLEGNAQPSEVMQYVRTSIGHRGFEAHWDVRARFGALSPATDSSPYQLTVFTV